MIMNTHQRERALIDACLRHDAQALHDLFVRFHRAVHAGAAKAIERRLAVCGTADDLTAQFFLQVVECPEKMLHGCVDRSDLAPWLTAVAYRRCSMMLRSHAWRWPGPRPIAQTQDLDRLPASVHHTLHKADILRRALELLDDPSRAIIELRFGLGRRKRARSIEEISARLGCDRATVYRRLREGIQRLRAVALALQDNLDE